jgi:beta-lactamase regulating signal transducer with metallopeptidase domain
MRFLAAWVAECLHRETIRVLGLTLGHFLWEGLVLALLLFIAVAFCRNAQTRYVLAVCTLGAMLITPVATFMMLSHSPQRVLTEVRSVGVVQIAGGISLVGGPGGLGLSDLLSLSTLFSSATWPAWFACLWGAGVLVFGMRALGGWLVLARLRRECTGAISRELLQKCRVLEERLGLTLPIRYLQSRAVETPSVMGWLRPVVLLPLSAISGLSAEQLEAVIVHELAHIRRLDCLVNLVQVGAETLFFYHPAVWWVNRVIRNERENCCDDISVAVCGNATEYARALTLLETARTAPTWALSATGGSLKMRVMRLLRPQRTVAAVSTAGLAVLGILCTTGVLLAAAAVTKADVQSVANAAAPKPPVILTPPVPEVGAPAVPAAPELPAIAAPAPGPLPEAPAIPAPPVSEIAEVNAAPKPPAEGSARGSYLEGLNAAGLKDLTVDQILALRTQGVDGDYIRAMQQENFQLSVDDLIAFKVQGISPEYVRKMRAAGFNPNVHELVAMKVQGITPEYFNEMHAAGFNPKLGELIAMKVQGITPAYVHEMQNAGLGTVNVNELIGMKVQGVDPEYVRAIRATGVNASLHDLIAFKVQDVTPEFIRAMQSAGLGELHARDYIAARVQDVTPEFIEKIRSHGFKNLTLHQLIALKNAQVF